MKTSRSNSTGRPALHNGNEHVLSIDEATNCCSRIATIAELLEACGNSEIEPDLVVRAGGMISDETEKLRELLGKFHETGRAMAARSRKNAG